MNGLKIMHLCEHCNKEYEMEIDSNGYSILQRCPHCNLQNHIWIHALLVKEEIKP